MASTRKTRKSTTATPFQPNASIDTPEFQQRMAETLYASARRQSSVFVDFAMKFARWSDLGHQLQQRAWQRQAITWQEANEKLQEARSYLDLMSVQSELLLAAWVQPMQWAVEALQAMLQSRPEDVKEVTETAEAVESPFNTMAAAWESMLRPSLAAASAAVH